MTIPVDRCTDLAVAEIHRLADACRGADPATPVPSCPEWDLAALQRHVGAIHRWAAAMVAEQAQRRLDRRTMDLGIPEDPAALPDWVAAGAEVVEAAFRTADPAAAMWAWGVPRTVAFWPRRMVHETAVHRADAELALGRPPSMTDEVASDGIDELLDNLPPAVRFSPTIAELRGDGESIGLSSKDVDDQWRIVLQPDGFVWAHDAVDAAGPMDVDARLETPTVTDLLLTLYRRRPADPSEIGGDAALVERWLANCIL